MMMGILGGIALVLADEERKLVPKDMIREFRIESLTMFIAAFFFLISISNTFWVLGPNHFYWRFYLWIIPFVLSAIQRRTMGIIGEIRKHRNKQSSSDAVKN